MVAARADIISIVADFVRRVETLGNIKVEKVVLYGSYAHGWPHMWSDFDLVVLSDGFRGMGHFQRIELLARIAYGLDRRIEPLAYTPGEYRRAGPATFLGEIKRTGKVVYQAA